MNWSSLLSYAISAVIMGEMAWYAVTKPDWKRAYRSLSWRLFALDVVVIAGVVLIVLLLYQLNQRIFGASWLLLLGDGNSSAVTMGARIKYVGILFCLVMFLALPYLARVEEEMFRQGTWGWRDGTLRSAVFGLAHMLMGVPFGAALALILPGLVFTACYFRGGLALAIQAHFQYNLILVTGLLAVAVAIAFS